MTHLRREPLSSESPHPFSDSSDPQDLSELQGQPSAVIQVLERPSIEADLIRVPNNLLEAELVPFQGTDIVIAKIFHECVGTANLDKNDKGKEFKRKMEHFLIHYNPSELQQLFHRLGIEHSFEGHNLFSLRGAIIKQAYINFTQGIFVIDIQRQNQFETIEIPLTDQADEWDDSCGVTHEDFIQLRRAYYAAKGKDGVPSLLSFRRYSKGPIDGFNPFSYRPEVVTGIKDGSLVIPSENKKTEKAKKPLLSQVKEILGDETEEKLHQARPFMQGARQHLRAMSHVVQVHTTQIDGRINELEQQILEPQMEAGRRKHLSAEINALRYKKQKLERIFLDLQQIKWIEMEMVLLLGGKPAISGEQQYIQFKQLYEQLKTIFINCKKGMFSRNPTLTHEEKKYILQIISMSSTGGRKNISRLYDEIVSEHNVDADAHWENLLLYHRRPKEEYLKYLQNMLVDQYGFTKEEVQNFAQILFEESLQIQEGRDLNSPSPKVDEDVDLSAPRPRHRPKR